MLSLVYWMLFRVPCSKSGPRAGLRVTTLINVEGRRVPDIRNGHDIEPWVSGSRFRG